MTSMHNKELQSWFPKRPIPLRYDTLNARQRETADAILDAMEGRSQQRCHFIDGLILIQLIPQDPVEAERRTSTTQSATSPSAGGAESSVSHGQESRPTSSHKIER